MTTRFGQTTFAIALGAVAWLAGAGVASAQDTPDAGLQDARAEFDERIEVEEVLLDVLVTDARGNAVVGLTPADFVVEEDGEAVELTAATFYSSSELLGDAGEIEARGAAVDTQPRDRYFILVFEDQRRNQQGAVDLVSQQLRAARAAKRWVRESLAPADWVAVLSYDVKLKLHQDFTGDRRDLIAAIDRAVAGKEGANWPSRQDAGAGDRGPSLAAHLPHGNELRDGSTRIYDALELLAEAAGATAGRKNMLLFTIGLGETDRFGLYREEQRYWLPMVEALNDNNVAVYTLDLTPADVSHSLEGSLSNLAQETGGRYYYRFASYEAPLSEIARENSGYYLLSYRSGHPAGESGFQQVKVSTKDPSLKILAREGYAF